MGYEVMPRPHGAEPEVSEGEMSWGGWLYIKPYRRQWRQESWRITMVWWILQQYLPHYHCIAVNEPRRNFGLGVRCRACGWKLIRTQSGIWADFIPHWRHNMSLVIYTASNTPGHCFTSHGGCHRSSYCCWKETSYITSILREMPEL